LAKNKKSKGLPRWLLWAGGIVGVLAIVSVIADACSLAERLGPTEAPISHEEVQIENSQAIVIGEQSVISGDVELRVEQQPLPAPTKDTLLYNIQIEGQNDNVVVAYNRRREPLWQEELDTKLIKAAVDDIDEDGNREVIVATHEPGPRPGWLLVFDDAGSLLDNYNAWKPSIYYGGAKQQMNISDFQTADLTTDGTKEIVLIAKDVYWYASRLSVLGFREGEFSELAEYWNPGLLYTLHIADINHDGVQEIVCTGVNNDLQGTLPLGGNVHSIFVLDGSVISGQAPPWFGNAPEGSEIWYGYVMPPSVRVVEVDFEDVDGDGLEEIHVALSDACSYYLDYEGDIVRRGRGTACKDESDLYVLQYRQ
jgi:hypothetical protein